MPAKPPILDNRVLNDILKQLQAGNTASEWKPPLEGDAGTMLQRIFARLMELAIQRLNQVPEKNLLAFLDTMGVNLLPPSPAKVPLTFALTPGTPPTFVPKGAQAGTQPSGQQLAVIFETEDDLTVIPAQLAMAFTMDPTWDRYSDQIPVLGSYNYKLCMKGKGGGVFLMVFEIINSY